ncbi:MAG: hypothetical protein KF906_10210 [Actinobacteria bacterium]|nr:hypothetical protein [Actinomycetota bacterium]
MLASCSSDGSDSSSTTAAAGGAATTTTAPEVERPDGPAAEVVREIDGDGSAFLGASRSTDLETAGYEEHEFVVSGSAVSYEPEGELSGDGMWTLAPSTDTADYTTRIVVRRPAEAADANGTVLVEWLNVSGGVDANPDYAYMEEEILRGGYTWVGVSAQSIGVEGGPVAVSIAPDNAMVGAIAGKGLKAIDPDRYGDLSHPGDQYSYDMYTQVTRALRADDGTLLGDIPTDQVIAVGESQSAFALTTYADGVQPLTEAFDGFFIHSRGGAPLPLAGRNGGDDVDIASAISGTPTRIRTDLRAKTLMVQSESDVLGVLNFYPARQPDSDTVATWEMAGTSHVDLHLLGSIADSFDCGAEINDGPMHIILKAALRSLDTWVRGGDAPPTAEPLAVEEQEGANRYVRDEIGVVEGGVRTPPVDVPIVVLSGEPGPSTNVACLLAGTTIPILPSDLAELYPTDDDYLSEYETSTDATIEAGFALEEDREALMDFAQPDLLAG